MAIPVPADQDISLLLQTIWDQLSIGNQWPTYNVIDRILYREHQINIDDVLRRAPEELVVGGRADGSGSPRAEEQLWLTPAGVMACKRSERAIDAFTDAIVAAVKLDREHLDGGYPKMKADQIIQGASDGGPGAVSAEVKSLARQVGLMLVFEPWVLSGSLYEGGWEIGIKRTVRAYSGVSSFNDYWTRRQQQLQPESDVPTFYEDKGTSMNENISEPIGTNDAPIFIVHGRNNEFKYQLARVLETATQNEVQILHEQANRGSTIMEKLERHAQEAGFAVVLLTGDDEGRLRGTTNINPRGRQNVILELGIFFGLLGRAHVVVLIERDVEKPSDIDGLVYIELDAAGAWRYELLRELGAANIKVDPSKIL